MGGKDDPSELFDVLSARLDETRSILEDAGVMSDRLRMPNKPPWDFEDFLDDDPTFLDRYLEGRKAEKPHVRVSVIQNPYLFTVRFKDENSGLIAGLGGVILRSEDGGHSWSYEHDGPQAGALLGGGGGRPRDRGGREGLHPRVRRRRHPLGRADRAEHSRPSSPSCATSPSTTSG